MRKLLFLFWAVNLVLPLAAVDIFVHPLKGDDNNQGTLESPLQNFTLALARARAGDTIEILPVAEPIIGNLRFHEKSGEPGMPITVNGNFNTFKGVKPVDLAEWQEVEPGLFKSAVQLKERQIPRYFMCFNQQMQRMGRSIKWKQAALKPVPELQDFEWSITDSGVVYFRIPAGKTSLECQVEEPDWKLVSGVMLSGKTAHLVIRNVIVKNFWNDGLNIHGSSQDILFENTAALYNGDDGASAHSDCEITIKNFVAIGNSNGICHINETRCEHENIYIANSASYDLYLLNRYNSVRNIVIVGQGPGGITLSNDSKEEGVVREHQLTHGVFLSQLEKGSRILFNKKVYVPASEIYSVNYTVVKNTLPPGWSPSQMTLEVSRKLQAVIEPLQQIFGDQLTPDTWPVIEVEKSPVVDLSPNSFYNKLSPEVVTPHIKWANPLSGGAVKALVVAPVCQRETLELAQRLAIECTPLMLFAYDEPYFKRGMLRQELDAMDVLFQEYLKQEYDVIIIGKVFWQRLPDYLRAGIIEKVNQGCGLVYIGAHEYDEIKPFFTGGDSKVRDQIASVVPLAALPVFKELDAEKLLSLGKAGTGRCAKIDYGEPPANRTWQSLTPNWGYVDSTAHYEYYQSLLSQVILWAAGRDPVIGITDMQAVPAESGVQLDFTLDAVEKTSAHITIIMRDQENSVLATEQFGVVLEPGSNKLEKLLPLPSEGLHFFDLWVKDHEQVVNWSSTAAEIKRKVRIRELVTTSAEYRQGDTIVGRVILDQEVPAELRCCIRLRDNFNRVVSYQEIPSVSREMEFKVPIRSALSLLLHLEAELYTDHNQIISRAKKEITVPVKTHDDFYFLMWAWSIHNIDNYVTDTMLKQFYADGVDSLYDAPPASSHGYQTKVRLLDRAKFARRANLNFVPYMLGLTSAAFESQEDPAKLERLRCYTSQEYREKTREVIKMTAPIVKAHGTSAYSLSINGEIGWRKDYCFSPSCQADFRVYLKKVYDSLDALNAEWSSNFTCWEDVAPITFEQAAATKNFVPWVDHRLHMEEVYADFLKFCGDEIRKIDPDALVGIDESRNTTSFSGFNWWRLLNTLDYVGSYTHNPGRFEQKEFTRSFLRQRPGYSGLWMGTYNRSEEYNRFIPWQALFNGMNTVWWWIGYNNDGMCTWSALEPGLKPLPFYTQACEEIREIKQGIGKLLINSQHQHDKIAILYSPESVHASFIVDGSDKHEDRSLYKSQMNFIYALEDLGLQYEFVATEQLQTGILTEKGYKIMLLPCIRALSDKSALAIKQYINGGGMVMADVAPAIMNEHCKMRTANPLAESFGNFVNQMQVVPYGKGKTVWMNSFMESYLTKRGKGENFALQQEFLQLLLMAGITLPVEIKDQHGKAVSGVEVTRFKNGSAEYLCLLRDFQNLPDYTPQNINIKLADPAHVYDTRVGKYLGKRNHLEMTIASARAKVLALLPYTVDKIRLELDKRTYKQGENLECQVTLDLSTSAANTHVLRVDLVNPDGERVAYQGENILFPVNEPLHIHKLLAFNETKGRWSVIVRDVATGITATEAFWIE